MSCAACQTRVEKAVSKVDGVKSCAVSLLTNSMGVEGDADPAAVISAVKKAGYGAKEVGAGKADVGKNDAEKQNAGTLDASWGALGSGTLNVSGTSHASEKADSLDTAEMEEMLKDHETPALKKRLLFSLVFLFVLLYFSMGHHMLDFPLPSFFDGNMVANGLIQMALAIVVMGINRKFFVNGLSSFVHGAPNMDTLVAMGSGVSFAYSFVVLLLMTRAQADMDAGKMTALMNDLYFESAAMIVTLITVGKMLEAISKGRTTSALKGLMKLAPKTANLLVDGKEVTVPVSKVEVGNLFALRPGESIPVDAYIVEGTSSVNEAAMTGESIPVDKKEGDFVYSGTLNTFGYLVCKAEKVGGDTALSQIIRLVSEAAATKAPIAKAADKVSAIFVPVVLAIAALTFGIWMVVGADVGFAIARAVSVLVISCPCALGLATPVAIMVGNGVGAKKGILFKTSSALEESGRVKVVALDKTGTITEGSPVVTDVIPAEGVMKEALLSVACSLEQKSEHPLAKAIVAYGEQNKVPLTEVLDFEAVVGGGLTGRETAKDGRRQALLGGSQTYLSGKAELETGLLEASERLSASGKTPLFFAKEEDGNAVQVLGLIAVADTIRSDSAAAVRLLKEMGIRTVMVTGDNERTAQAIGAQAGVDRVIASVLPEGKADVIKSLGAEGKTMMVGDGINDAPALTAADVGVAIGAGSDIAIDAADVVVMKSRLMDVAEAIRLSRAVIRNIHENLFWAFIYNIIGIPLAAGAYIHAFGWSMNPMFGAAAMSLSSFFVVTNALRLNFFRMQGEDGRPLQEKQATDREAAPAQGSVPDQGVAQVQAISPKQDAAPEQTTEPDAGTAPKQTIFYHQEEKTMTTRTMKIEGMMCGHCEARVKKALEALPGVESAEVSHEKGEALVHLSGQESDEALKKAVEEQDYIVKEIR
ncbi:MAG: heavy metal translocating P-type ATPase [Lachnospiraceae bacterium]|nr:heavy metal translocating P-type ATPase [Lachnospiraceae bacterium]MBF1012101.1 heavy metal translocating P-type ATPase [Lachnospiraceae bacterium]